MKNSNPIILFDGICNLCNGAVNFTIKRDKQKVIRFASFQSEAGKELVKEYGLPVENMLSFIFIERRKAYNKSTAALRVCKYFKGLWPLCFGLMIVPKFIRDGIYDWIAKNRYKWFGKRNECMIPTPDLRASFLNESSVL